jgi:hypothetical protein
VPEELLERQRAAGREQPIMFRLVLAEEQAAAGRDIAGFDHGDERLADVHIADHDAFEAGVRTTTASRDGVTQVGG